MKKLLLLSAILFSISSYGQRTDKTYPLKTIEQQIMTFDTTTVTRVSIAIGTTLTVKMKLHANGAVYYIPKYFCLNTPVCYTCRNYVGFKKLIN